MMKKILLALALVAIAAPSFAQAVKQKEVQLQFVRAGNPAWPFPNSSGGALLRGDVANQKSGEASAAVAFENRDTTASIFVGDHIARLTPLYRSSTGVSGSFGPGDTTAVLGTLNLRSSAAAIDSIKVLRQISNDGMVWATVDSLSYSVITQNSVFAQAAGDSLGVILAVSGNPTVGGLGGFGSVTFPASAFVTPSGVTRIAVNGFNYIRFIVKMTLSDQFLAGASGGVSGSFSYPAIAAADRQ